tara:strand:- start:152 stop:541 length:390 start_codon:yes stop_codon:yes gene_type:complete
MKNKYFISFILVFFFPLVGNANWIKIFTTSHGDLFIESNSIKRDKNRIFYDQLVNYRSIQKNGSRSFITTSEVDCKSLKVRDVNYQLFKQQMGKGNNFYKGSPLKKWKKYQEGTSAQLINKLLCDRVYY